MGSQVGSKKGQRRGCPGRFWNLLLPCLESILGEGSFLRMLFSPQPPCVCLPVLPHSRYGGPKEVLSFFSLPNCSGWLQLFIPVTHSQTPATCSVLAYFPPHHDFVPEFCFSSWVPAPVALFCSRWQFNDEPFNIVPCLFLWSYPDHRQNWFHIAIGLQVLTPTCPSVLH